MIKINDTIIYNDNRSLNFIVNTNYAQIFDDLDGILSSLKNVDSYKVDKKTHCGVLTIKNKNDYFLKKFMYVSKFHAFYHRILKSRAKHLWVISKILINKQINVPEPIMFYDNYPENYSIFISKNIKETINLGEFAKRNGFKGFDEFSTNLALLILQFHQKGFIHGDLKWSNILINNNNELFLVDLDNVKYQSKPDFKGVLKDYIRFYKFGLEVSCENWIDNQFFPLLLKLSKIKFVNDLFLKKVKNQATNEWRRSGYRTF